MVSTEVARYTGVDTADVPSAQWGWSSVNPRIWHVVGLGMVVFLLCMLHGNHIGHIEDLFLVGFAALTFVFVVRDWWGRRRGWLR